MTEIIPHHNDYPMCFSKEKLHNKKMSQEFSKELEKLKPLHVMSENKIAQQHALSVRSSKVDSQKILKKFEISTGFKENQATQDDMVGARSKSFRYAAHKETSGTVLETVGSMSSPTTSRRDINVHVVRKSFPTEILSFVESVPLVGSVSQIVAPDSRSDSVTSSKSFQDIHISVGLMEEFMELARSNTEKDLETCGVLGASFKNHTFYTTTLIIPKQEGTCSSCQALNEEEIYAVQEELSLFPVGWIHTHPSQTCFMSSIDLHTQYSYQVMLPEAVAIVMAPTDTTRKYGIFHLSDPAGISILKNCQERGFHPHPEPADGIPIYEDCSNVYVNPNLRFEIIDLRCLS